jgi:hypothetical protein
MAKQIKKQTKTRARKSGDIVLAKWQGRFGNRMHQYAYGASYADKFNLNFLLPSKWEGDFLFKDSCHKVLKDEELKLNINQSKGDFDNNDHRKKAFEDYSFRSKKNMLFLDPSNNSRCWSGLKNVWFSDIAAYNSEIFSGMSLNFLKNIFKFKDEIKNLDIYKKLEDKQGTYDIAHLRRDDISNPSYDSNYGYSVISKKSYEKAFKKFDIDPSKVEWTSDDWSGKWGVGKPSDNDWFTRRGSWFYPDGSEYFKDIAFDWFPDFLRIYFARSVFRANSSFSFWACLLGVQEKIYSPVLTERNIYSGRRGSGIEISPNFIEGNSPHWLVLKDEPCGNILIPE